MGLNNEQFFQKIVLSRQMLFEALKSFHDQMNVDDISLIENKTAAAVNSLLFNLQVGNAERSLEQKKLFSFLRLLQLLFQMEDLLCFEGSMNDFKPMMLAQLMAENIIKEWTLVENHDESLSYYVQRLTEAEQQLNRAQRDCVSIFMDYHQKTADLDAGLPDLLQNYLEALNDALVLEKDSRALKGWVANLPWHDLLIRLSQTLFPAEHISASPEKIALQQGLIVKIVQELEEDSESNLQLRKTNYKGLLTAVQIEFAKASEILTGYQRPAVSPMQNTPMTSVSVPSRYMFLAGRQDVEKVSEGAIRPNRN